MELQIVISFPRKINTYFTELKRSLLKQFDLEIYTPKEIQILRVPVNSEGKSNVDRIVRRHLDNKEFKIRFATKYNTDQISLTNSKIEIAVDERSWNTIVDFQKPLLDEIEQYIDSSNPIIFKGDTHSTS